MKERIDADWFCNRLRWCFSSASAVTASAQPISLNLDLVADGSIRSELFSCIRRGMSSGFDVSFVEENDPSKTHTISIRALPSVAGRRTIGYAASLAVIKHIPAPLREQLTSHLQGEQKTRALAELAEVRHHRTRAHRDPAAEPG